jgi:hypothetical protein
MGVHETGRQTLDTENEATYMDLENGRSIVLLKTVYALDMESERFGRTVPLLDRRRMRGDELWLSLRDADGASAMLFAVDTTRAVIDYIEWADLADDRGACLRAISPLIARDRLGMGVSARTMGGHVWDTWGGIHRVAGLPPGLKVDGDLDLRCTGIDSLPDDLVVSGRLSIGDTDIRALPDRLKIGSLSMEKGQVKELPKHSMEVTGGLCLRDSGVTAMPERLVVHGDLSLVGVKCKRLPRVLEVGGYLDLRHSSFLCLPENLRAGSMGLGHTHIRAIPPSARLSNWPDLLASCVVEIPKGVVARSNPLDSLAVFLSLLVRRLLPA